MSTYPYFECTTALSQELSDEIFECVKAFCNSHERTTIINLIEALNMLMGTTFTMFSDKTSAIRAFEHNVGMITECLNRLPKETFGYKYH